MPAIDYNQLHVGDISLRVAQSIVSHHPEIESIRITSWIAAQNFSDRSGKEQKSDLIGAIKTSGYISERAYSRKEFLTLKLEDIPVTKQNQLWGLVSRVKCRDGTTKQIPMMDIDPKGLTIEEMIERVKLVCGGKPGALLKSGKGIHYYGDYLLTEEEWLKFLALFLLSQGLECNRCVGHSLSRGFCNLRLTATKEIKPTVPYVVELIGQL